MQAGRQLNSTDEILDLDKLNELGRPSIRVNEGAIGTRELAPKSITADKLDLNINQQLSVGDNSVTTNKLVPAAVTEAKMADQVIGASKLKNSLFTELEAATEFAEADLLMIHRTAAGGPPVSGTLAAVMCRPFALLQDVRTNNTNGGTFTAGSWVTRTLNTLTTNYKSCVSSLTANEFTLPAGRYMLRGRAPAFSVNFHKCRLYNVSENAVQAMGTTEHSGNGQTTSTVTAMLAIDTAKIFRLEHRCSSTQNNNGLGNSANFAADEIYAEVEIWRVFNG